MIIFGVRIDCGYLGGGVIEEADNFWRVISMHFRIFLMSMSRMGKLCS